ncbi:xaa-Arg dipeptidase-like [Halichondria panicea]|uniref:xaa-Arg dipeptidase-like n=1 Tax=Halichondria panicea TaxID=6063 RepID=UPI00312B6573
MHNGGELATLYCNQEMDTAVKSEVKSTASAGIESCKSELSALSDEIWRNPELGFNEHKAHELLTNFLEKKGFTVERSYTGIETAFRATFGSGRPNVCVICEYDALPEIGHACGHNLIAEAGVAAGLGLKAVLESKEMKGTVTIMGTPDEESKGGKVYLIEKGAFENIDLAMMVHPAPVNELKMAALACVDWKITYTGKAAHAAAFPWEGVNALDAAVMAYTSISALRQQMKPTCRVHGIISNGGAKPNIIPEKTELMYMIRGYKRTETLDLCARVRDCFDSAAIATGCQVKIEEDSKFFEDMNSNDTLAKLFLKNIEELGVLNMVESTGELGSTDMGNVSYIVPSIHPCYAIGSGEVNHTREFTAVTNTPEAHTATLTAAKAMAHTCIDVLTTDGLLEKIKEDFKTQ